MTPAQREGLRLAEGRPTLREIVLTALGVLAVILVCSVMAPARWNADYANADPKIRSWFKDQHNAQGQWCCDESDGARFDGTYSFNDDGSVTLFVDGGKRTLPAYMVLKGPNPTGHAIWWHLGETDYCFAPGTLS